MQPKAYELLARLGEMIQAGEITQAQVLEVLHDCGAAPQHRDEIRAATDHVDVVDRLSIDLKPLVSVADDGVWVSAWVWVANDEDDDE